MSTSYLRHGQSFKRYEGSLALSQMIVILLLKPEVISTETFKIPLDSVSKQTSIRAIPLGALGMPKSSNSHKLLS
ncbi:hypothetical protein ACB092_06G207600 [Castanea dentata]